MPVELRCPALWNGHIAACRFCVFYIDSRESLCLRMQRSYYESQRILKERIDNRPEADYTRE